MTGLQHLCEHDDNSQVGREFHSAQNEILRHNLPSIKTKKIVFFNFSGPQ